MAVSHLPHGGEFSSLRKLVWYFSLEGFLYGSFNPGCRATHV